MLIRVARASDADAAAALWTEAYTARGEGEGRTLPYAATDFHDAAARGEPFVAEQGGEVVGVVIFLPPGADGVAIAGEGEGELSRLAVAEAARRRGVGRALAQRVELRARESGAEALVLWSRPISATPTASTNRSATAAPPSATGPTRRAAESFWSTISPTRGRLAR